MRPTFIPMNRPLPLLIIHVTSPARQIAVTIADAIEGCEIISHASLKPEDLAGRSAIIFIGAMGICVRTIAPILSDKLTDPAIVCVDTTATFAISVASGHVGGANELTGRVAAILGATPVITTRSDRTGTWPLDTLARQYGWKTPVSGKRMSAAVMSFVGGAPTAYVVETPCCGTDMLDRSIPSNVTRFTSLSQVDPSLFRLIIVVTARILPEKLGTTPLLPFYPPVLSLGVGCRKNCDPEGIASFIISQIENSGLSSLAIGHIATIDIKKDERLIKSLAETLGIASADIYTAADLADVPVPNPSPRVARATGVPSVAEASALLCASRGPLLIEKQKGRLGEGSDFTFALALDRHAARKAHVEIVGAGPGDPELVSVRGRRFLEQADLILYAGSLVPRALTLCAKEGAEVRSSAGMNLQQQFELMKRHYDLGHLIVRLHTGDPCIYGAIQEQMNLFDEAGMSYHITPGISSFQAAAAELRSQFTIPERVQSIILTRGEGRTPMPEKEQLSKLARSQSTMCIYLSADIVEKVQEELLTSYPPETPVAACYKLTWPEQRIYRGRLDQLTSLVRDNNLSLTTLLVVGEAIDNRHGLSRLYDHSFTHLFRKGDA